MSEDLHFSTYSEKNGNRLSTSEEWVSENAEAAWEFYRKHEHVSEEETEFCTLELIDFFQDCQFHGVVADGADEIVELLTKQIKSVNAENDWNAMTQISWY